MVAREMFMPPTREEGWMCKDSSTKLCSNQGPVLNHFLLLRNSQVHLKYWTELLCKEQHCLRLAEVRENTYKQRDLHTHTSHTLQTCTDTHTEMYTYHKHAHVYRYTTHTQTYSAHMQAHKHTLHAHRQTHTPYVHRYANTYTLYTYPTHTYTHTHT